MSSSATAELGAFATFQRSGANTALRLSGRLDSGGVVQAWPTVLEAIGAAAKGTLRVDATEVTFCDGSGIGLFAALIVAWRTAGGTAEVSGLAADILRLVDVAAAVKPLQEPAPTGFIVSSGIATIAMVKTIRDLVTFIGSVILVFVPALLRPWSIRWGDALQAFLKVGVLALPVVCLLCFLIGGIIAFQTIGPMAQYGAKLQVAQVVAVAIVRELGPLITAIILAGRSGSAFAAEIGTMRVTQEIDALSTFGLEPVRFLVVPRMIAAMVATPLLTAFGNLMGLAGGYPVLLANGFTLAQYTGQIQSILTPIDLLQGLVKAFVFAVLVGATGCYCGLRTKEGPGAVGDSTTRAVVAGIVLIVAADAILGSFFHVIGI